MRPDYVSPIEDKRNYRDATDLAMRLAQTGATVEQQEELVKDPRHAWKLKQYEEDVQKYNEKERLGQFAVDPAEIARLEAEVTTQEKLKDFAPKNRLPKVFWHKPRCNKIQTRICEKGDFVVLRQQLPRKWCRSAS